MSEAALYQQILGLKAPWVVSSVQLDEPRQSIIVTIAYASQAGFKCPICHNASRHYDSRLRKWRHLDTCQYQTLIQANVPRVHCTSHGYQTLQVPWASGSSRYTELFEMRVLTLLAMSSLNAVSRFFKLSWGAIDRIMARAVYRGLAKRKLINTDYLLVDETALKKGHEYVTLLSNHEGQVLAVSEGRSAASFDACLTQLPADALRQTQSICMDMSPAYIKAAKKALPNAERKIAFDHFHVAKMLTEAVNRIRKDELFRLAPSMRQEAHRTRFYWLKRRDNLSDPDRERVNRLIPAMMNTALAWYFKEQARNIWHGNSVRGTKQRWKDWIALAKASGLKPLMAVADTIENKLWGILNAMRFGLSNGLAEAINSQVRLLRVKAMGYRNSERFQRAILFHFGKLDMGFHQ